VTDKISGKGACQKRFSKLPAGSTCKVYPQCAFVRADSQFACHGTAQFGAPQPYVAVTLTPIGAAAEALSSYGDDFRQATRYLLIDTIYAKK